VARGKKSREKNLSSSFSFLTQEERQGVKEKKEKKKGRKGGISHTRST